MSDRPIRLAGSVLVAAATAVVVLALSILPFLNPVWVGFEQDRAEAAAWTGYTPGELKQATDAILADLVLGPPDFDVAVGGQPVLNARERGHMADVRSVFVAVGATALVALVGLAAAGFAIAALAPRARFAFWRAIRAGAALLAVGVVAVGIVGLVAFDAAFEVFHRLFFAGGTYTFDPRTDRLVQLFPQRFWFETSVAVGVVILVLCAGTAWLAGRRLRADVPPFAAPRTSLGVAR